MDGIRAIAILAVALFHAYRALFPGGWAGVDVFFVLSGYLITRLLSEELRSSGTIGLMRFYLRRSLRLGPALYFMLACLVLYTLLFSKHRTENLQAIAMAGTYLMNWNKAFNWLPEFYLGHTWTLAVEEQFYILWPLTLTFIWTKRPVVWVSAGIVLITCWRCYLVNNGADIDRTYTGIDTHADVLLIGCLLALVPIGSRVRALARRFVIVPLIACLVTLLTLRIDSNLARFFGATIIAAASAWLLIAALEAGPLRRLLSLRPLVFTGRISYGWYLWHEPMLRIAIAGHVVPARWGAVPVAAAYTVAVASYFIIERPFLRLKARFEPTRQRAEKSLISLAPVGARTPPPVADATARSTGAP